MTTLDKSSNLTELPNFETYVRTRDEYLANALELIGKNELRKASELLWGAVAQSVKALAALSGTMFSHHREFSPFMQKIASELREPNLYGDFKILNNLHRNFYDEEIPREDFPDIYGRTERFLKRMNDLIEIKVKEKMHSRGASIG